jgi:two-component system nitrogen regulation sensor histidine kinase GlnL
MKGGGRITMREVELAVPDQTLMLDVTISPAMEDLADKASVVLELNRIDRVSRLAKETDQLDRQQTYRLMMRSLAHEIKNPLGGLRGAAQLLHREVGVDGQEYTNIMIHEADRLTALVDRIMGSSKPIEQKDLNIHRVLEHVVHLVLAGAGDQLRVVRDYDPSLPGLKGDSEQLVQVVLNVVKNAVEVQNGSGVVGLRTRIEYMFIIGKKTHRQVLCVQIWDHGPGVPEELKDRLFDPMITGRAEGTGLGLSIAQDIIHRHGGLIELGEYKGNTCFTFFLPINGIDQSLEHSPDPRDPLTIMQGGRH